MPHPRHEWVRARYGCACGYCGVSEDETGGQLTVDHYRPVAAGGDESDENLVYACFRCNTQKGEYWSAPGSPQALLHPLLDDTATHLQLDPATGRLVALTCRGKTHINLLRLNRPELVANRDRRVADEAVAERTKWLEAQVGWLRRELEIRDEEISILRRLLREADKG
jgi:hypothetical protein